MNHGNFSKKAEEEKGRVTETVPSPTTPGAPQSEEQEETIKPLSKNIFYDCCSLSVPSLKCTWFDSFYGRNPWFWLGFGFEWYNTECTTLKSLWALSVHHWFPTKCMCAYSLSIMGRACLWMNILVRLTADSNSFLFVFFKNKTKKWL